DMEPEARYADIAVDILLEDMFDKKSCPYRNVDLYLYGGISSRQGDFFKTGEENVKSIKKAIFMKNLKVAFEDTGGFTTRTVTAYANDGAVLVDRLPKIMF
ncbi:MAG: hypothetical protein HGA22_13330, partial [Clostridiales bacterium]|nr:hypothetical protein [Clostridiales bacterium]